MGDSYSGLVIVNVTDPSAPTLAGGYDTDANASDVAVSVIMHM